MSSLQTVASLLNASKCFSCIQDKQSVKSYLLNRWNNSQQPQQSSLEIDLEYYPIDGNPPWYDATRYTMTEYKHTRFDAETWGNELFAAGGPIEVAGVDFTSNPVYAFCFHLDPSGKFVGNVDGFPVINTFGTIDLQVAGYAQAIAASQLWYVVDGADWYYWVVSPANIAAGWTSSSFVKAVNPNAADFVANWMTRGLNLQLLNRGVSQFSPDTLRKPTVWTDGIYLEADQALDFNISPGAISHAMRYDTLNNGVDPWNRSWAYLFRPEDATNSLVADLRGVGTYAHILYCDTSVPGAADMTWYIGAAATDIASLPWNPGDWILAVLRFDDSTGTAYFDAFNVSTSDTVSQVEGPGQPPWTAIAGLSFAGELARVIWQVGHDTYYGVPAYMSLDRVYQWKRFLSDSEVIDLFSAGLIWEPAY